MPSGVIVSVGSKLRNIEAITDAANLLALQRVAPQLLEAIKAAAPRSKGGDQEGEATTAHIADTIYLEAPRLYGRNKYQVRVRVPDEQKAKLQYIIKGTKGGKRIVPRAGLALAFSFAKAEGNPRSKDGRNVYKYIVQGARAPNNFPKRAVRANAFRLAHLWAKQIIVSVNQK